MRLLVLIFILHLVDGERKVVFSGKKVVCNEFNKKYFYNVTCDMKLINRNKQLYSLNISVKPIVIGPIKMHMKSYYKFRTEYRPIGVSMADDACSYVKFLNDTKLITLANFKALPTHYLNDVCPIKGPIDFNVEDFEIVPMHLPDIVPIGDWYFETISNTIVNGKEIFLVNIKNYFVMRYEY